MHILALETSHLRGSIHLAEDRQGQFLSRSGRTLPERLATAQCFAPCIREMLQNAGIRPREVGLVAVDVGPGSFTGLRIAVTFGKTFAYASGASVLGISSMDVLAFQGAAALDATVRRLWTLVDAHRGQVFAAGYEVGHGIPVRQIVSTRAIKIDCWLAELEPGDAVTGPIVERIAGRLPDGVEGVPGAARIPSAESVARIAWQRWQKGERGDIWQLRPDYIRKSAAEERLNVLPS